MKTKPAYYDKHPCDGCGTGYLECIQGARMDLKCCSKCDHPTRWVTDPPYTEEEISAMMGED